MTRAQARARLRGWLQEDVADQWSDADLNECINLGIRDAQKVVVALDPEGVKKTYTANIVVPATGKDAIYSYPAGAWAVIEVATSSDGTNYTPLRRLSLKVARGGSTGSDGGFVPWDPTHFALFPPPTSAVTNGLRVIVVPTLTVAAETDVLPTPRALDKLVLMNAERLALKKAGESLDKIEAEIQQEIQEASRFFLTSTESAFVVPLMDRYG